MASPKTESAVSVALASYRELGYSQDSILEQYEVAQKFTSHVSRDIAF